MHLFNEIHLSCLTCLSNAEMVIQNKIVGQSERSVGIYVASIDLVRSLL